MSSKDYISSQRWRIS